MRRTGVKCREQRLSEPLSCTQVTPSTSVHLAKVYPRCSDWCSTERCSALQWLLTKQLFDQPLFWQRSLLSKNSSFSFFSFCGEVDLFLQCPSPCLVSPQVSFDSCSSECSDYSSSTRPLPWASVLLSTVPLKLWETGRSGLAIALNIYTLRGSRGVQAKTSLFKHFHIEKYMIVYLKKSYYCSFYCSELNRLLCYYNMLFTSISTGRLCQRSGWYLQRLFAQNNLTVDNMK